MIIKINDKVQYEAETAKMVDGRIVATRADGTEFVIGGDLSAIKVIGGEIEETPNSSVWDELDAAYQEGVDSV